MNVTLMNSSPHSLLYMCVATAIETVTLTNDSTPTPDLSTDALSCVSKSPNGLPLFELLQTLVTTQAECRWLLLGGGTQPASAQSSAQPNGFSRARRARVEITPGGEAGADLFWAVDAILDPSGNGRAALSIQVDGTIAGEDDLMYLRVFWDAPEYTGLDLGST